MSAIDELQKMVRERALEREREISARVQRAVEEFNRPGVSEALESARKIQDALPRRLVVSLGEPSDPRLREALKHARTVRDAKHEGDEWLC